MMTLLVTVDGQTTSYPINHAHVYKGVLIYQHVNGEPGLVELAATQLVEFEANDSDQ